ncbi:MAG: glycosyl transferase [Desulfobacterales bacterium RIFOXYA12_FULL_46_15]|nr:MAG: glycosyl transferase [Desulfobacterales bacterium RIFOXYA12_FULL_46_15]
MKILIYCQHVLGVGHFFRTLEIARAMKDFDVILVTGGDEVSALLPNHVRKVALPGLMMDQGFSRLYCVDPLKDLEEVKLERKNILLDLVRTEKPDFFLVELYPFGRRAFEFELIPVLTFIKARQGIDCKVVCSLRDILVEKKNPVKYETRVIEALHTWFDAVLVHSDPGLIKLDATFPGMDKIKIPLVYTGFVTPVPDPEKVSRIREGCGLKQGKLLITASVGGGNVGAPLLKAVVHACHGVLSGKNLLLKAYTGPYMDQEDRDYLKSFENERITIEAFTPDFVSLLGASDLSVSMAGYNTCMNIVAAGVPALVLPFAQNREQWERAAKLAGFAPITLLEDQDLEPLRLARRIEAALHRPAGFPGPKLNMNGAVNTMEWMRSR